MKAPIDDAELLSAVLSRDEDAWRALIQRYEEPLREVVRLATRFADAQIDDVLGDLWLALVEHDMRRLRSCARGPSLLSMLSFHVSQIAQQHLQRVGAEPRWVSLDEAGQVPDLRAGTAPRGETRMMRVEELAKRWDLNVKTIYGMIERRELHARRFGRVLRVPRAVVESIEQASVAPERSKKACR